MVVQPLLGEQGEFLGILGGNTALRDGEAYLNLRGRYLGEAGHVLLMTAEGRVISYPDLARLMRPLEGVAGVAHGACRPSELSGQAVGEKPGDAVRGDVSTQCSMTTLFQQFPLRLIVIWSLCRPSLQSNSCDDYQLLHIVMDQKNPAEAG